MTVIKIKAQIQPTEDPEKVTKALTNLFGNIQLNHDHEENMITGKIEEITQLKELRNRIAQDRIRTTLSNTLTRWMDDDYLSFGLNRQAAYAGHVSLNLTNEDPMGPIQLQIRGDVLALIEFLCN
ncbi:MAG: RNA-binding domain-containing protein [Candidatus Bathyarchaeota archaeon]